MTTPRYPPRVRRCVLLFVLAFACRRSETSPPPDGDSTTPGNTGGGASSGGATTEPPERCAGGTEWSGKPEGCAYEVDGCCYADAEAACTAVKCARETCEILETYPAQVRCRAK